MRLREVVSAEELLGLWKLISDNVWTAINTQSQQQASAPQAETRRTAAAGKPKRTKPNQAHQDSETGATTQAAHTTGSSQTSHRSTAAEAIDGTAGLESEKSTGTTTPAHHCVWTHKVIRLE